MQSADTSADNPTRTTLTPPGCPPRPDGEPCTGSLLSRLSPAAKGWGAIPAFRAKLSQTTAAGAPGSSPASSTGCKKPYRARSASRDDSRAHRESQSAPRRTGVTPAEPIAAPAPAGRNGQRRRRQARAGRRRQERAAPAPAARADRRRHKTHPSATVQGASAAHRPVAGGGAGRLGPWDHRNFPPAC